MSEPKTVGGQAVIEGVMMRSPKSLSIAVRRPNGEIAITERKWESLWEKYTFLRKPFLRGAIVLVESLVNGVQALSFSANQAMIGLDEKDSRKTADARSSPPSARDAASGGEEASPADAPAKGEPEPGRAEGNPDEGMSKWVLYSTLVLSLAFAFALFKGLPHMLAFLIGLPTDGSLFHVIDGIIKIFLFVGYILLIRRLPDIRRVFQYHGAEHKSIYVFESGEDLSVENARKYTTLHPRCGTSFILFVLLTSILLFLVVFRFLPPLHENRFINAALQIAIKLPLMLPIAGISYEFLKWSSRHLDKAWVRVLVQPGLWMQRLTTEEPDDSQLEIALTALRKVLWREKQTDPEETAGGRTEVFRSFSEIPY